MIETAWKAAPHPALWLAYRDLEAVRRDAESSWPRGCPAKSAFSPEARESRILMVEQALVAGDAPGARTAAVALDREPLTRRLAGLQKPPSPPAIATKPAPGSPAAWCAPQELRLVGPRSAGAGAFAYTTADDLGAAGGRLRRARRAGPPEVRAARALHEDPPRTARRLCRRRTPFIGAAETGEPLPPIIDDGDFGQELQPADAADAPAAQPRARRAFGPRGKARPAAGPPAATPTLQIRRKPY